MSWFRFESSLRRHRKVKHLARSLKIDRVTALGHVAALFAEVCDQSPDGCLDGWDHDDIAEAGLWEGDAGEFVAALIWVRFLIEEEHNPIRVNSWMEYAEGYKAAIRKQKHRVERHGKNSSGEVYLMHSKTLGRIKIGFSVNPKRRLEEIARADAEDVAIVATVKGTIDLETLLHDKLAAERFGASEWFEITAKTRELCRETFHCEIPGRPGNVPRSTSGTSPGRLGPVDPPTHPPTHVPTNQPYMPPSATPSHIQEVEEVVDVYKRSHPTRGKHLKPSHKDWARIKARLEEGFSVDDLKLAIKGNLLDQWHKDKRAHTVEFVFRNASKVEQFVNIAREGGNRAEGWIGATQDLIKEAEHEDRQIDILSHYGPPAALLPPRDTG